MIHATVMGIGPNRFIIWSRFEGPRRTAPGQAGEARSVARSEAGGHSAVAPLSETAVLVPTLKSKRSRRCAANKKVVENPKWILN